MRFSEFSDIGIDEDVSTALDVKSRQLDNQAQQIKNRKKALSNLKLQKANREAVRKMAGNAIKSK